MCFLWMAEIIQTDDSNCNGLPNFTTKYSESFCQEFPRRALLPQD